MWIGRWTDVDKRVAARVAADGLEALQPEARGLPELWRGFLARGAQQQAGQNQAAVGWSDGEEGGDETSHGVNVAGFGAACKPRAGAMLFLAASHSFRHAQPAASTLRRHRPAGWVVLRPAGLAIALRVRQRLIFFRLPEIDSHIRRTIPVDRRQKPRRGAMTG